MDYDINEGHSCCTYIHQYRHDDNCDHEKEELFEVPGEPQYPIG